VKKRLWIITLIVIVCVWNVCSQTEDALFNQYFSATGYYNPAFVGKSGELNVLAISRAQWLGIENAPTSICIIADMPWQYRKLSQGLGIVVMNESIGLDRNFYVSGQYSYQHKLGKKGTLGIGLQVGLVNKIFQGDSIYIPDGSEDLETEDEVFSRTELEGKSVDIAAGIVYFNDVYYFGIGTNHILAPKIKLDENTERKIERSYNLTAGYNIQLKNSLIELQPSVMILSNLQMVSMDVTARAVYNKMFNGGIGGHISDNGKFGAFVLYLGAVIKGFKLGYAYEFPTSAINKGTMGSHEFLVSYHLKLNNKKGLKNKHKSIRIL